MVAIVKYLVSNIRLLLLLIVTLLVLGFSSLLSMPKAEDPQFDMPISVVEILAPGMSPDVLETQVVKPIEQALSLTEDIKSIETKIIQGSITFTIRFLYGTDPDSSFDEVVRAVGRVRADFPKGVQRTLFFKAAPTTVNVLQLAVSSVDNDWQSLQRAAVKLKYILEAIIDVRRADIRGLPQLVVKVEADPKKLLRHNVSITELQAAVAARADNSQAGFIDDGDTRFMVSMSGEYADINEILTTQVRADNHGKLLVSDVAQVALSLYKPDNLTFVDEQPVVFVTAQQRSGINIFTLFGQIEQQVNAFSQAHPDIQIQTIFSQKDSVEQRVSSFMMDLLNGLILILVCLLFFMGFKQALWVSLALPLTIFGALIVLNSLDFALQQMTIAGLIVSLGLLVDNSLVVVEQFTKHDKGELSRLEVIQRVVSEVGLPLTAGTLTTVLAFLPLLLLQTDTGDFMRAMPFAVSVALLLSLLIALVILPSLMMFFGVSKPSRFTLSYLLDEFAHNLYSRFLNRILKIPSLVVLIFVIGVGLCISLFGQVGVSLFPKAEKNMVLVNLETPVSSSFAHTQQVALDLGNELAELPDVSSVVTNVGGTNPRIYYNHMSKRGQANFAQLLLLTDQYDASKIQQLINNIRAKYQDYELAEVNVFEFQQGPVTDRPITIRLMGDDLPLLIARSNEVTEFIRSRQHVFNTENISDEAALNYEIKINELKARLAGLSLYEAERQLISLIDGQTIGAMSDRYGQGFQIVVQGQAFDLTMLDELYLMNSQGKAIPLVSIAEVQIKPLIAPFYHYQKRRMAQVSADVLPSGNVAQITAEIEQYLQSLSWVDGLTYIVGGEEEARKESFGGLSQIMILVVVAIFVVLFLQFKNFVQPVIIISLLPIAFAGGIWGLFVTGMSFSMMAFIGLISLIGIMVNDAIIVVDGFNRANTNIVDVKQAMIESATGRFTPVILTSLTTVVGLLPLTLYGGELWLPMGTVIITGLLFTTLASLLWVPALTVILAKRLRK